MHYYSSPICFGHSCDSHDGGHHDGGPLFGAAHSTAEWAASSVAVQHLMSSALRARSTGYCRASGFIGRCSAVNVVRSPRAQHWVPQNGRLHRSLCSVATTSDVRCELGIIYDVEDKLRSSSLRNFSVASHSIPFNHVWMGVVSDD
jgi:hypothetical protein